MNYLLKYAKLFELLVSYSAVSRIEEVKEEKKKQIREAIQHYDIPVVVRLVKDFYNIIKSDDQLLQEVATYLVDYYFRGDSKKVFTSQHKELLNKTFNIMLDRFDNDIVVRNLLSSYGDIISPQLIREFTLRLLSEVKKESELDGQPYLWGPLGYIEQLLQDQNIRPHIDVPLFERVLAHYDPHRLPEFKIENTKQLYKTTDVLAFLFGRRDLNKSRNLTLPQLLEIIQKSTPQAQELWRSVLWEAYQGGGRSFGETTKFMLDSEFKPVDVNERPIDIYSNIAVAHESSFSRYSAEDQAARVKWQQLFADYKIVPLIPF